MSLSLCLPAPSSLCLFCAVLRWCCTAAAFSVRPLAFVFQPCSSCVLSPSCTFPALEMGSLCSAADPCSRAPCSSLPLLPCADSRTLMLNWPYKKMRYLTPSFPELGFQFLHAVCMLALSSRHLEERERFNAQLREALARGLAGRAVTPEQHICAEMLAQSKTRLVLTLTISPRRSVIAFRRFISSCRILLPHCTRAAFPQPGGGGRAWGARMFPSSVAQLPVLPSAAHQLSGCHTLSHLLL